LLFDGIILKSVLHIEQERTGASIYYLLTGNRSIQTVQDAHMYGLDHFYGIHKSLTKKRIDRKTQELIQNGLLTEKTDEANRRFLLSTEKTAIWLKSNQSTLPFHYFNGISYHEKAEVFYQRLLLLIQTFTNTRSGNFSFIPVVDQPIAARWVKRFYKRMKGKERDYLLELEEELQRLLSGFPDTYASIFVDRLSGYKHYGKSIAQLTDDYNSEENDIQLLLVGILHSILTSIQKNETDFPALNIMMEDQKNSIQLLDSTAKTYQLYKQNRTAEQIAGIRRLKINTVYDHLAEISLYDPGFPFTSYITKLEQQEILSAIEETKSYKLKAIKEKVNPEISFFQIRLMLVLHHRLKEVGETNA